MTKITHAIDNNAPLLPIENVTLTGKAKHDANRFKEMTIWNRTLMNQIIKMYRTKGVIDSHNKFAGLRVTKLKRQHKIMNRYDTENLELLIRLLKTVNYLNLCDLYKLNDLFLISRLQITTLQNICVIGDVIK